MRVLAAEGILAVHLLVIGFNLFGLVVTPIGAALGWRFVRVRWWRALHVASLAIVALQALAGRACFLTLWQDALTRRQGAPMIMSLVNRAIFWPLPLWVFSAAYVLVFLYAVALWWLVPPHAADRTA